MIKNFKDNNSMEIVFQAYYTGSEVVYNKETKAKFRRVGLMQDGSDVITFIYDKDQPFNLQEDVDKPIKATITARLTPSGKYFNLIIYKIELDK